MTVIELNRKALRKLRGEARLEVIAGASHLFSEPGALEHVARLACHGYGVICRTVGENVFL